MIEHVAAAEQVLRADCIEDDARVCARGDGERQPGGEVGFDEAGDNVGRRPLGGHDQMDARRPRHLGQPAESALYVTGVHVHQVGQFVNEDGDVGQAVFALGLAVVAADVARADRLE